MFYCPVVVVFVYVILLLSKGPLPRVYFCLELNSNRGYLEDKGVRKKSITEVSRLLSRHLLQWCYPFMFLLELGYLFSFFLFSLFS